MDKQIDGQQDSKPANHADWTDRETASVLTSSISWRSFRAKRLATTTSKEEVAYLASCGSLTEDRVGACCVFKYMSHTTSIP